MWTSPDWVRVAVAVRARVRGRSGEVGANAVDDIAGHRLGRPAAAVQGRARVSGFEVRSSPAPRPRPGDGPALRRRTGRRTLFVSRSARRQGGTVLRPP